MLEQPKSIQLDDVLITEELARRLPRQPNLQAENQAMRSLARQLAQAPEGMLQHLVDLAVELCDAGTAGISLVETQPDGKVVFRWVAMAGLLASHVGSCTPRNFSPCGVCLEQGSAVLFTHPERYFAYLQAVNTPLVEGLVLPLIADGQPLGAIWIAAHDKQRQFDLEDVRLMTGLADFTVTLLRSQQQANQLWAALRKSETRFRQIFDNNMVAMGIWTPTGAIADANDALLDLIGYTRADLEAGAIRWTELTPPEYHERDLQAVAEVRAKGACIPYEKEFIHKDGYRQPILIGSGRFDECTGTGIFCAFDISDRKQAEATIAADLKDTRLLHDLTMQVASDNQGQDLFQSILDTAIALMHSDMGSLQILNPERNELYLQAWRGFHPEAATGWQTVGLDDGSSCAAALYQGERIIVPDVETCEFMVGTTDLAFYRLCGTRAVQSTPLLSHGGQFIGMISTHWREPYAPSERELRFLDLLARQAADLIEHQQAQDTLHKSEEKYRALFESIDEGYAVVEVMADDSGVWNDFLFLEVNPAFMKQTGLGYPVGRKATELLEAPNPKWAQVCGHVAETGEPIRFEAGEAALGRIFDLYVFRLGGDGSRCVAALFTDITDRKRAEAALQANAERQSFLLEFSDALRPLVDAEEIRYQAACILGQHLGANRVGYAETDDNDETIVVTRNYIDGVPGIEGRYRYDDYGPELLREFKAGRTVVRSDIANDPSLTDAEKAAHAVLQLGATINVPLLKAGQLVAVLFVHFQVAHAWTDGELALIAEVAERIWDAVERARAEVALRESEAKYRLLFNSMDEGYFLCDVIFDENDSPIDILYVDANPAATQMVGSDFTGRRLRDINPNYEAYWYEIFGRVARTGQGERLQQYAEPDQTWYDFYVFKVGDTNKRQIAVVFQDISARKQAEATITADLRDTQRLRELSARLASEEDVQVLYNEIMAAAIALTRADAGTVQILDEATQDLVLLATQGFDAYVTDHFHRVNASSQTSCGLALRGGQRTFIDFDDPERDDPDGSLQIHVDAGYRSAQSTPLVTRSGRPIGMVSTHWCDHYRPTERELRFLDLLARQAADLIEQRQAELERRQLLAREQAAREAAEKANRIKDEFLAILSHELRSPLNPILGWAKLLQSKPFDPAMTQQALSTIERNAKIQTQLIDDLLDIARILRGKLKIEETTVNLATVIEAALEVVKTAAQAKSIALQFNPTASCHVRGDESRLQQICWNLLSNAIKFTPKGGQVGVCLETCNGQAQITVTDTGQGISPGFMPYLFQSFRQEDASITRRSGGLGLGLAIVKHLVDAHGGSITAASPGVGQGATFTVQMPLLETVSAPPVAPRSSGIDLNGLKVLAVDDSEDTRALLDTILSAYGAETCVVASGTEVLANIGTFVPDVLICDIGMPDLDGYTLLQQIRALPETHGSNIPAIAVTAFAREDDRQRTLDQGFQQHVAKPVEPEQLVRAIAQLVLR